MHDTAADGMAVTGEAELLLREFAHRTANEIAAATAALRLVVGARRVASRGRLVMEAIGRLESFGELHRVLARPLPATIDVSPLLETTCRALAQARPDATRSSLLVDLPSTTVDGRMARRLTLIAAELVSNAIRHALAGRRGSLTVTLRQVGGDLVLSVIDDGPGLRADACTPGMGLGRGIVADLAAAGGGSITTDTGPLGTAVRIVMPMGEEENGFVF